ncbi:outer dense fiber protein 4 [Ornithorhynchus anatinus]|uniref:outer dense fiber protein 4 n=1 Tax=Ornithorhynchus anatinus TaxID=9258 RepID=UPI0019D493A8|nr:outer dense fiber protein 4 [Ornithorhynchus anatinus]
MDLSRAGGEEKEEAGALREWEALMDAWAGAQGESPQPPLPPLSKRFPRRLSKLPLRRRLLQEARFLTRVVATGLSTVGFLLMVTAALSPHWLKTHSVHLNETAALPSIPGGPWEPCVQDCSTLVVSINASAHTLGRQHLLLEATKFSFLLAMISGFLLTCWLFCTFLPLSQKVTSFDLIAACSCGFTESCLLFTLLLYPIHLQLVLAEGKEGVRLELGNFLDWSYFLGWMVTLIYLACGVLCYLNHRNFWSILPRQRQQFPTTSRNSVSEAPEWQESWTGGGAAATPATKKPIKFPSCPTSPIPNRTPSLSP